MAHEPTSTAARRRLQSWFEPLRRSKMRLALMLLGTGLICGGLYLLLGPRHDSMAWSWRRLGFDPQTGVNVSMGVRVGPIETEFAPDLADQGITGKYLATKHQASGGLLSHRESWQVLVEVTTKHHALDSGDLAYTLYDDQEREVGRGKLRTNTRLEVDKTGTFEIDNPALRVTHRILIHK